MISDADLDPDVLLAPIPGSLPAGSDLRYDSLYDRIKAARRAADDKYHGKSGFSDPEAKQPPEERAAAAAELRVALRSLLIETLTRQSKDLQLAVWLLEVETYLRGFVGAAGAIELIARLLETFWDTCHPAIQEDDEPLALRAGVMEWINEKLPEILKSIPLSSGAQRYPLAFYELAEKATDESSKKELARAGRPSLEQFVQVMSASSAPHLEATAANLERCLAQVIQLEQVADRRFVVRTMSGGVERSVALLSFSQVRKVLEDCQFHVGRALRAKAPRPAASATAGVPAGGADTERYASATGGDDVWGRALQLVMQGQLDGLRLAQDHIDAAASGRERFLRQLQLSELCLQAGMHAFAYPILDDLGKIIDQRDLITWEDVDVIRRTWSGLATVCKSLARLRPDSVAREEVAQQRLSALATDGRNVVADT